MADAEKKPTEKIKKESRKHPRVAVYLKVTSSGIPKLKEYSTCSYNLSLGGIMLVITPPLKNASEIKINDQLTLSFVISTKSGLLNILSKVVWVKDYVLTPESESASCLGIEFLSVPEETKVLINAFLKGDLSSKAKTEKKTCRDCIHFKPNAKSKYAFCMLHRITILNSEADPSLSFNQIYSYPCKDLKLKE